MLFSNQDLKHVRAILAKAISVTYYPWPEGRGNLATLFLHVLHLPSNQLAYSGRMVLEF